MALYLAADVGGTFTDCVVWDEDANSLAVQKLFNGPMGGVDAIPRAASALGMDIGAIARILHGTTLVTNVLVERTGAAVGLLTTRGFRDVLEIGTSYRQRTFDVRYRKTMPLVPRRRRLEVGGRIDFIGNELEPLDEAEVERRLKSLADSGVEAIAVSLMNSYANPVHERRVRELAEKFVPDLPISLSFDVDPRIGEYERTSTCVLNAVAGPAFARYVDKMTRHLGRGTDIRYMHSSGGVVSQAEAVARPIQLALSGPTGGVTASRVLTEAIGLEKVITMDMGGTSCDVCLVVDGRAQVRDTLTIDWQVPARVEALDINTVGAGGGSIIWEDVGGSVRVGPRSAGAVPGPACYGNGGVEPTITDANLVLGLLSPRGLLGGTMPLDDAAARRALATKAERVGCTIEELAAGAWKVVNANVAQGIRAITVEIGVDPRECALLAFGGAGPQHAAGVAAELGVARLVIPPQNAVWSAIGVLRADLSVSLSRSIRAPLSWLDDASSAAVWRELEDDAWRRLTPGLDGVVARRRVGVRYRGQWNEVRVDIAPSDTAIDVYERFETEHERLYGTRLGFEAEISELGLTLTSPSETGGIAARVPTSARLDAGTEQTREISLGRSKAVALVRERGALPADRWYDGPMLLEEDNTVSYVPAAAKVRRDESGYLDIRLGDGREIG